MKKMINVFFKRFKNQVDIYGTTLNAHLLLKDLVVDILTKPLSEFKFQQFLFKLSGWSKIKQDDCKLCVESC